jgi:endo-1,4-beta-xylanase
LCPAQSLRQAGDRDGILIGTAVRPAKLSETDYATTLAREFSMVEAEDAMKWWVLRRDRAAFDFRQGDELVRFAQAHQMKVRGHCLVWGLDNPDWLKQGHFTARQLSRLLHEHITRVMKHYSGQVFAWDVVNEAFDENGSVRDSIWYNQPGIGLSGKGTAYIEQVFRWAHKADPHALLFYNEAEGEGLNRKSDAIYAMVKDFKHRGVQVHITELDVSLPVDSGGQLRTDDLTRQADIYRGIVRACLNSAGCTAIQTWGFTDKYSWIGSHSRGTRGQALPFDRAYQPKPAYRAVLEELSAGRPAAH